MSWLFRLTYERSFTMRGAARVTPQLHQILRLPPKITVISDPRHIWNVISNAQSSKSHPATSPNTALATQNECHDWSASHMKRHLQCAEPQASPCNLTKCCACHAKRNDSIVTAHIWNVIYNVRSDRNLPPTSPNTAPATQKECHDWSASHMKRHLQCAERQASPCNLTKYCACHAKGMTLLLLLTYETSFTMRGATGISLQPHQILRLPRKRNVMIDPHHIWNVIYNARRDRHRGITLQPHQILRLPRERNDSIVTAHIWNVIYNARSDRHHPATSPDTAPATQNCTPKS